MTKKSISLSTNCKFTDKLRKQYSNSELEIIFYIDTYLRTILGPILIKTANKFMFSHQTKKIYCNCFGCSLLKNTYDVIEGTKSNNFSFDWLTSNIQLQDDQNFTNKIQQLIYSKLNLSNCQYYNDFFLQVAQSMNGLIRTMITCNQCKLVVENNTNFLKIECLPFVNIQASVTFFFTKQLIEQNDYACEHCGSKYVSCVQNQLIKAPKFLYIGVQQERNFQKSEIKVKNINIMRTLYITKMNMDNEIHTVEYELLSIVIFQNDDTRDVTEIFYENQNVHTFQFTSEIKSDSSHDNDKLCELLYELKDPNAFTCSNILDNYLNDEKDILNDFINLETRDFNISEFDMNTHKNTQEIPYVDKIFYTKNSNELNSYERIDDDQNSQDPIVTFGNNEDFRYDVATDTFHQIINETNNIENQIDKFDLWHDLNIDDYPELNYVNEPKGSKNVHTLGISNSIMKDEVEKTRIELGTNNDQISPRKSIGLINPNNMCYANAIFQAIFLDLMIKYDESRAGKETRKTLCTCIGCILQKLTRTYRKANSAFNPYLYHKWVNAHKQTKYNITAHEDVHELMKIILMNLDKRQNLCKNEFSQISNNFVGLFSNKLVCQKCSFVTKREEEFNELISFPANTVSDLIKDFFEPTYIEDYVCSNCLHNIMVSKEIKIKVLPNILCIVTNRFDSDANKVKNIMKIDRILNLEQYIDEIDELSECTYTLHSFVCHKGNYSDSGHYYTVLSTPTPNRFVIINDNEIIVKNDLHNNDFEDVYLLFYRLRPNINTKKVTGKNDANYELKLKRFTEISKNVKVKYTDPMVTEQINKLLFENTDVFHLEGDMLTSCDILEHTIPLHTNSKPVNIRPYNRRSKFEKDEIEKHVQKLIDLKLVEPCRSPYNSPLHLVKKGIDDKGQIRTRIVMDYRSLNDLTIPEVFPSVQVVDILDQLHGSRYYSSLDLSRGYSQIKLSKDCQIKTAFTSGYNTYSWVRMPLGLRSSSHTFNRVMSIALADLIGKILYIFLDDIIVYSKSIPEHMERLQTVFDTLRKHNLKLSPKKCNLLQLSLPFLGFVISEKGVIPDPRKITPILNIPRPKNPKGIKSFMGMVNYYGRHIPKLAEHAKPLHNLLKKDAKFIWSDECQKAFDHFKTCLTTPPILQFPDFDKTFYVSTDASKVSIAAILSQMREGKLLPICYASRTLQGAEVRYGATQTEVLAVVWGLNYFKTYINNRFFEVFTDCKALQWLLQLKSPNSRLIRWKFELAGYDFKINHIKGKDNVVADCLSRYTYNEETKHIDVITRAQANKTQAESNYRTPEQNIQNIENQKAAPIQINELPTIIESTDAKLIQKFPVKLLICRADKYEPDIDIESKRSGQIIHKPISEEFIILTDGLFINANELSNTISELRILFKKAEITKVYFARNDFTGNSEEYEMIKNLIYKEFEGSNTHFLFLKDKITLLQNRKEIEQILKDFHDSPLAGHQGVHRMAHKIGQQYKWIGLRKDVQNYVRNCRVCQLTKPKGLSKLPMQITSSSQNVFSKIHVDNIGPMPDNEQGFKYVFTFQDDLTRYFGAIPIVDHTADTVARTMVENVILRFGLPEIIFSDLGVEWINDLFPRIMKILGIKHHKTSPYHPQANGLLERSHSILKAVLRSRTNNFVQNWPQFVPYAVFVINSSVNRSTNYSPHEMVFGYKLDLPSNLKRKPEPVYNYEDYLSQLRFKLQSAHQAAKEEILKSKITNKKYYDKKSKIRTYEVGDMILLTNENRETKLHNPFKGPFKVTEIISDVNVKIKIKNKEKIVHINRTKRFYEDPINETQELSHTE